MTATYIVVLFTLLVGGNVEQRTAVVTEEACKRIVTEAATAKLEEGQLLHRAVCVELKARTLPKPEQAEPAPGAPEEEKPQAPKQHSASIDPKDYWGA